MNDATLAQGNQVMNLILQKKLSVHQLQELLGSGLLSDLLDAAKINKITEVDRENFRRAVGLELLIPTVTITVDSNAPLKYDRSKDGWKKESDITEPGGEITLELAEFLQPGENSVNGSIFVERVKAKDALFGQRHAEALLANQEAIPEEWRQYYIVFPGTVWVDPYGLRRVPYLYWNGDEWILHFRWLGSAFDSRARLLRARK